MTLFDGGNTPGFKYLGKTKDGLWGKYVEDSGSTQKNYTEEEKRRWAESQRQRRESKEKRLSDLLSIPDRDKSSRNLISKLDLSLSHKKKLEQDRHLSEEEIEWLVQLGWIRSWQPRQNFVGIDKRLPGVHPISGDLLGVEGIALFALDPYLNITGAQIACDNRDKGSKYIWLSSNSKGGSSPHLPNGECHFSVGYILMLVMNLLTLYYL
jgi:hypothetical protein